MNERIEELITATDIWCDQNLPINWTDDVDQYLPVWNEKFAELIVRECADLLMQAAEELEDQSPNKGYFEIAADLSETIKHHFGVE